MILRIPCRPRFGGCGRWIHLLALQATDAGTARAEDGGFIGQSAEGMGQNQAGRIQLSFSQQKTWRDFCLEKKSVVLESLLEKKNTNP